MGRSSVTSSPGAASGSFPRPYANRLDQAGAVGPVGDRALHRAGKTTGRATCGSASVDERGTSGGVSAPGQAGPQARNKDSYRPSFFDFVSSPVRAPGDSEHLARAPQAAGLS